MCKKSFVLYNEYADHVNQLANEEAGKLFKAVLEYAGTGALPDNLAPTTLMAFGFIRAQMDRDLAKWEKTRQKRSEAGKAGAQARAEKQNQANQANANFAKQNQQSQANQAVYVDGNVYVDGDVNGDVNGDANGTVDVLANELSIPPSFLPTIHEWFTYKENRGEEQTASTIQSTLKQIKTNIDKYGQQAVADLIGLSIKKGWKGIFFDRLKEKERSESDGSSQGYSEPERHGIILR